MNSVSMSDNDLEQFDFFDSFDHSMFEGFDDEELSNITQLDDEEFVSRLQYLYPLTSSTQTISKTKPKSKHRQRPQLTPEQRERRNQRRRVNIFPRVLKRDTRRLYAQMFLNVFNAGDDALLHQYLMTYYTPMMEIEKIMLQDIRGDLIRYHYDSKGYQAMNNFFQTYYHLMPDLIAQMISSQVCIDEKKNTTSIVLRMKVTGTLIKYRSISEFEQLVQRNLRNKWLLTATSGESLSSMQAKYCQTIQRFTRSEITHDMIGKSTCLSLIEQYYLLPKPIPSVLNTYLILHLNDQHMIDRFEIMHLDTTIALGTLSL